MNNIQTLSTQLYDIAEQLTGYMVSVDDLHENSAVGQNAATPATRPDDEAMPKKLDAAQEAYLSYFSQSHPAYGYQPEPGVHEGRVIDEWFSPLDVHLKIEFTNLKGKPYGWFHLPAGSDAQKTYDSMKIAYDLLWEDYQAIKLYVEDMVNDGGFDRSVVQLVLMSESITYDSHAKNLSIVNDLRNTNPKIGEVAASDKTAFALRPEISREETIGE